MPRRKCLADLKRRTLKCRDFAILKSKAEGGRGLGGHAGSMMMLRRLVGEKGEEGN